MFMLIGTGRCPACGIAGKLLRKRPETFVCPACAAVFTEFGFVFEPSAIHEIRFS